jgi:predicted phosphoribosyltransferase
MAERLFRDRRDAGRVLARMLEPYHGRRDVLVLALPRGGVPVAYEVATALNAPLDVFLVRKLGIPGHEELAMGAIAAGGVIVLDDDVVRGFGIGPDVVQRVVERERLELLRREQAYREGRPPPDLTGRVVILVDDGLATGSSMRAAVVALRQREAARIVVAVPAAPASTCAEMRALADEVVCATTPSPFLAVGNSYWDFEQTSDEEVRRLLREAAALQPAPSSRDGRASEAAALGAAGARHRGHLPSRHRAAEPLLPLPPRRPVRRGDAHRRHPRPRAAGAHRTVGARRGARDLPLRGMRRGRVT